MMMSHQVGRMITTRVRKIGLSKAGRLTIKSSRPAIGSRLFKSTQALSNDFEDELDYRSKVHSTIKEPWMINLNRGNDDAWLSDTRDETEWFTGVAPRYCPGMYLLFFVRLDDADDDRFFLYFLRNAFIQPLLMICEIHL
jgi:hypothetical protein